MDKEKLFYVIHRGTNSRVMNSPGEPLIVKNEGIMLQKEWYSDDKFEMMYIKDYEDMYMEISKPDKSD